MLTISWDAIYIQRIPDKNPKNENIECPHIYFFFVRKAITRKSKNPNIKHIPHNGKMSAIFVSMNPVAKRMKIGANRH
jgi:hypothetical protein